MKSYSVKSNAKRFARGLAAKNQALEVIEPVETEDGSKDWYPAVKVVGDVDRVAIFKEFRDVAIIHGLALDGILADEANAEGDAGVYAVPPDDLSEALANENAVIAAEGVRPEDGVDVSHMVGAGAVTVDLPYGPEQAAIVERLLTEGHTVVAPDHAGVMVKHEPEFTIEVDAVNTPETVASGKLFASTDVASGRVEIPVEGWNDGRVVEIEEADGTEEAEAPLTMAEVKAVANALATLPPRVKRTPEEIAKSREERRARIEAGEYKATAPAAKEAKVPKSALVYEAIKAEGGASFDDLIEITAWQKHTLRGYIAGTLRKRAKAEGLEIEAFKVKGEPTRYRALPA